jgi:hypothetical protein
VPQSLYEKARLDGALLFHHCRPLEFSTYDLAVPVRLTDILPKPAACPAPTEGHCEWDDWHDALHMEASYRWLAERVGFWPLWLAVGADEEAAYMSGYSSQFARLLSWSKQGRVYRQPGAFPSDVLFSWAQSPAGARYLDYSNWHYPLNAVYEVSRHQKDCEVPKSFEPSIFRPSWSETRWLREALREPGTVQAVSPLLDLRSADRVRVRSAAAKRELVARGFPGERVEVYRLAVRSW